MVNTEQRLAVVTGEGPGETVAGFEVERQSVRWIVADPSVAVMAVFSPNSACNEIMKLVDAGVIGLLVSEEIVDLVKEKVKQECIKMVDRIEVNSGLNMEEKEERVSSLADRAGWVLGLFEKGEKIAVGGAGVVRGTKLKLRDLPYITVLANVDEQKYHGKVAIVTDHTWFYRRARSFLLPVVRARNFVKRRSVRKLIEQLPEEE